MSGFLYRYRNNEPVERHAKGIDRHVDGAGSNPDSGDDVHPFNWSDGIGAGDFGDSEPIQGQNLPPHSGMRSDGLRDALMDLHDRGRIDLFSHMADFLSGLDEDEAGEHADIHRMAHNWARRNGYYTGRDRVERHVGSVHPHTKAVQEIADMYDHDHDEDDDSGDREIGMGWQDEINLRAKQAGEALARPHSRHHTAFLNRMANNVVEPEHWGNDWMDRDTYAAGNHIANHARLALGMDPLPDHWMET